MKTRIVIGATLIAVLVGLMLLDWSLERHILRQAGDSPFLQAQALQDAPLYALPTAAILGALAVVGFLELARLAMGSGIGLLPVSGLVGTAAVATSPWWFRLIGYQSPPQYELGPALVLLAVVTLAVFAEQMWRHRTEAAIERIGSTLLAAAYLGICAALILYLRMRGLGMLIVFLAAVKCTDIGAYFTGSFIGKHKLIPWLSPGKTWEGLAGGILGGALAALLLGLIFQTPLNWWQLLVFGPVVAAFSQFADLCESLMKRSANLKDSGSLMPEFGGVLDLVDSPLLSAPVALIMLDLLT